jgi:hypothetical protein
LYICNGLNVDWLKQTCLLFFCIFLGATITISFESNVTNTLVKFSRLNIWKSVLSEHEILYMSYKCGQENGTYMQWNEYRNNIITVPNHYVTEYKSTCTGKQGKILVLKVIGHIFTTCLHCCAELYC